jgi:RNase P subunit RPR2
MGNGKFPVYKTHKLAKKIGCFKCYADLSKQKHVVTEYHVGHGHYSITCTNCNATTWYDIERELKRRNKNGVKI